MNENKIREALVAINGNPKDEKAAGLLRRELTGYRVIARQPNGSVDVDETMQNLAFALETGCTAMDGCLAVDELLAKEKPKIEADPVDGRPLRNGKTVTQPIVNWQPVSIERRRLAVLAKIRRELPHAASSVPSEMIAYDLAQERPPAPWPRMELEMEKLQKAAKETTKEGRTARDLLEAVEEGLWFQRAAASAPVPVQYRTDPPAIENKISPVTPMSIGITDRSALRKAMEQIFRSTNDFDAFVSDFFPTVKQRFGDGMDRTRRENILFEQVSIEAIIAGVVSAVPGSRAMFEGTAPAGTDLFIVAVDRDLRKADELFRHCWAIKKKQGSWLCPSGANRDAWLRAEINKARVIVAVLSPDLLYDDAMMNLLQSSYKDGKRVVPWVARACDWKSTFLGALRELPEEEHLATGDIKRLLPIP